MKIYIFVTAYPSAYKPYYDTQFVDLLRAGHDVRIFAMGCLDRVYGPKVVEHGLLGRTSYYFPPQRRSLPTHLPHLTRAFMSSPIRRARTALKVMNSLANGAGQLHHACRSLMLPLDAPDLCLVHALQTMSLFPWLRLAYPEAPIALYYHGGEPAEAGEMSSEAARRGFAAADLVFTNTSFSRDEAVRRGADAARVNIVPVGFDLRDYPAQEPRTYRQDGVLRLISAGRLSEGKGIDHAIEAVRRLVAAGLDALHYTIVGSGPVRRRLEALVRDLGLERYISFAGALPNPDLIALLGCSDALVLSSYSVGTWTETQAAVVQEALLMRGVVVTTRTGGVPESVPEEMRPFSVPERDPAALAAAIERVYRLSQEELRDLGARGRAWAEQNYDIRGLNERILSVCHVAPRVDAPPLAPSSVRNALAG